MEGPAKSVVVLVTAPTAEKAAEIGRAVVEEGLAACVNVLPECRSVYRWEGKLEHATEVPLLIKTTRGAYPELEQALRKSHPYELPEIVAVPVAAGLPDYLNWVAQETQPRNQA